MKNMIPLEKGRPTFNAGNLLDSLQFDEYGFLLDPQDWTEEVAAAIAMHDGIGSLQKKHWQAILFIRDRYLRLGAIPPIRNLCRGSGLEREEFKKLFGSCAEVWRIAGLPDPGEDIRNHMQ